MKHTWPQTTKDSIEGREWIHPTPPRYYLHLYPKADERHGKHLGKYAGKWVVIDRDPDLVHTGPYARKSDCVKAFFRSMTNP